jgi:hypothetical protein
MPRPTHGHQQVAGEIVIQLVRRLGPRASPEVSIYTDRGIRAPDVVWTPAHRWLEAKGENPLPFVPDVCVQVVSPSNTRQESLIKVGTYLRGGAREVIVVGLKGEIEFFGPGGKLETSALAIGLELPAELFYPPHPRRAAEITPSRVAAQAFNAGLTLQCWPVGDRIRPEILREKRAAYGEEVASSLGRGRRQRRAVIDVACSVLACAARSPHHRASNRHASAPHASQSVSTTLARGCASAWKSRSNVAA